MPDRDERIWHENCSLSEMQGPVTRLGLEAEPTAGMWIHKHAYIGIHNSRLQSSFRAAASRMQSKNRVPTNVWGSRRGGSSVPA